MLQHSLQGFFSEDNLNPIYTQLPHPGNFEHIPFTYNFVHPFSHLENRIKIYLTIYSAIIK